MSRVAILFGVLLIILGLVGYFSPATLGERGREGHVADGPHPGRRSGRCCSCAA